MRRFVLAAAAVLALAFSANAFATTYYVSAGGSDSASGTSTSTPWASVHRVDNAALQPGDTVLFRGGDTFTDDTLMPASSGSSSAPITFSSYGTGRATISNANGAVWFSGKHYLTFDGLVLTSGGSSNGVFAGSSGGGSDHIVLRNSVVTGSAGLGLISPTHDDSAWTISGNTFSNLGDSALIVFGSGVSITGNTIQHVGWNNSISYAKHGVYAKGPDMTIAGNDISDVAGGQAVSIRFHGAHVYGNAIHDTAYGFAFFDYDTAAAPQGTSYVYNNRLWNITGYGFYYDNQLDPNGKLPTVDFVVASNTFSFANASEAVNVAPSGSAHVTLVNNIFAGSYGSAFRGATTTVENHNDWSGAASNVPTGTGDRTSAPDLTAAPGLALPSGSTLVDGGTAAAPLAYVPTCDGSPLSFCGLAPDYGAVEAAAAAPAPTPPPAAPDRTPPTVSFASPTAGGTVPLAFRILASASDNVGVSSVAFSVDGAQRCVAKAAPFVCDVTVSKGYHTLKLVASDAARNIASSTVRVQALRTVRAAASVAPRRRLARRARHVGSR